MQATSALNPKSYNRVAARDYARRFAGEPGTMSTKGYNTAYQSFNPNDCANFISQCLRAGGLSTTSKWKPYTLAWVNTGFHKQYYGLTEYMYDQGVFFKSNDRNKAFAGSIVVWTDISHVGIVDQNDGVTMTYCAHTTNRKSSSLKGLKNVRFLIPTWDSYTGNWTVK